MPTFLEHEAKELLSRYGVLTTMPRLANDAASAAAIAREFGGTVAMKVASPDIIHKSRIGGVRLNVAPEAAGQAFDDIVAAVKDVGVGRVEGVIVEPMAAPGLEVIVGAMRDPVFGPVIMFGRGGTDVERIGTVIFGLAPLSENDAWAMISAIVGSRNLPGEIDDKTAKGLVDVLLAIGGTEGLVLREAVIELDVNPLVVTDGDITAVDAHLVSDPDDSLDAEALGIGTAKRIKAVQSMLFDSLQSLFMPHSIVVVGASTKPMKLGFRIIQNLIDYGFPGQLFAVHPSANNIYGCPAYPSVDALPETADRAIVIVPAGSVIEALHQCADNGVRVAQVYTAGFGEWSDEGEVLEDTVKEIADTTGMRIVGPNSIGTFCAAGGVTMSTPRNTPPNPGGVTFISQSGTYALDVVRRSLLLGIPLGKSLSCGNCVDLTPTDYLMYCAEDPETDIIAMYLETVKDAGRFFRLAAAVEKPLVIFKGGRTEAGTRAATSHTGALASDARIWMDAARQAGAIVVDNITELLDVLLGYSAFGTVPGRRLGIFGSGGGVSVLAADVTATSGMELSDFSDSTKAGLEKFGVPGTSVKNPIDIPVWGLMMDGRFIFHEIVDLLARDPAVDSVITFVEMNSIFEFSDDEFAALRQMDGIMESILKTETGDLPVSVVLRTSGSQVEDDFVRAARLRLLERGIAAYPTTARAIQAHTRLAALGRPWA